MTSQATSVEDFVANYKTSDERLIANEMVIFGSVHKKPDLVFRQQVITYCIENPLLAPAELHEALFNDEVATAKRENSVKGAPPYKSPYLANLAEAFLIRARERGLATFTEGMCNTQFPTILAFDKMSLPLELLNHLIDETPKQADLPENSRLRGWMLDVVIPFFTRRRDALFGDNPERLH